MKTVTSYKFEQKDCPPVVIIGNYQVPIVWQMIYSHRLTYGKQENKVTFIKFARNLLDLSLKEAVRLVSDAFETADFDAANG